MATLLSNKKSTYGGPYAFYTLEVTEVKRTPVEVTLKCKVTANLQYSNSWLGTGAGYGLTAGIYLNGDWYNWTLKSESTKWSGTTKHSASREITIPASAATSSLSVKFRVKRTGSADPASLSETTCNAMSITKVSDQYSGVDLTGSASSQESIKITLSDIPSKVGYQRVICWYKGSTLVHVTTLVSSSTVTSISWTFNGLHPSTTYTLKAVIKNYDETGTTLASRSVSVKTKDETGSLTLSCGANYITASVSGMYDGPSYDRKVEIYYKKSSASSYTLWKTLSSTGTSTKTTITGLISNTKYDVQIRIKDGSSTLKTLTKTITTKELASFYVIEEANIATDIKTWMDVNSADPLYKVPEPFIESVVQEFGTKNCNVEWGTDRSVSGTTYRIQAKVEGGSWITVKTLTTVTSPVTVTAPESEKTVHFRVLSKTSSLSAKNKVSGSVSLYIQGLFKWDTEKVAGHPFIITAEEWNRLGKYVAARYKSLKGVTINIPAVKAGDLITAEVYNTMKDHITAGISEVAVGDKKPGDAILAADIDALRVAANANR